MGRQGRASAALTPLLVGAALLLAGCADPDDGGVSLEGRTLENRLAYIPPQCYTIAKVAALRHNPCYVCHAEAPEPNPNGQPELQQEYAFPQLQAGRVPRNPWTNLFKDRRAEVAAIADADMARYVAEDNYHGANGTLRLTERLAQLPARWDADGNGRWDGYRPDAWLNFDAQGWDHAPDGTPTGWRSFVYHPFPGAFMPTNGSFDDVAIRLPAAFRRDAQGRESLAVYTVNLAIVESLITRQDVPIDPVDERALGTDLDGDGHLGMADHIAYIWPAEPQRRMRYAGQAGAQQAAGQVHLAAGLYPEGTEFLHSVRYLAVGNDGTVSASPRMKELRYARKDGWRTYSQLRHTASIEGKEQALKPENPEVFPGNAERGLSNRQGWVYQGFIEDRRGQLRPQSFEETVYCMGCHSGISATEDGSFAFARKLRTGAAHGWLAWSDMVHQPPVPDPLRTDGQPEYASYLRANHAGDEFRENLELLTKYFGPDGREKPEAFARLATDVSSMTLPSPQRAMALNKAYWLLVREQSFKAGRSPVVAPATNVYQEVPQDATTGVEEPLPAPRLAAARDVAYPAH
ncbi:hypothetical protein [Pseudacidovorax sp. 1753]|uniref:hypothetical protein n=1 Tax=Pseudacidovorax sp. 1753 TaxID=3156419 RepID=UPI003395A0A7